MAVVVKEDVKLVLPVGVPVAAVVVVAVETLAAVVAHHHTLQEDQ